MKFVTTFAAMAVGAFLFAGGVQAAPLSASSSVPEAVAESAMTPVACRSVTRRVCRDGRCRVSKTRICTPRQRDCRTVTTKTCERHRGRRVCKIVKRRSCG
jgi:hypothetical protein